jgi:hypothetical protein
MITRFNLTRISMSLIAAAFIAIPVAGAATMTKTDYSDGKTRISAEYKSEKKACAALRDNAKDICVEEAKGKHAIAKAELEYAYTGKSADSNKVLVAKAKAVYAVAKERCDDKSGNAKNVCVKEAKAVEIKALADAKMGKQIGEARKDAAEDKRDADYKVAIEKCDMLAGEPKSGCVASAKKTFGKS